MHNLDVIIPVYNEDIEVVKQTISALKESFADRSDVRLIVVNDGSHKSYGLERLSDYDGITYVEHDHNRGYGTALKTGILSGDANWIAITDADGTYPVSELPKLAERMQGQDMVIGIRTGAICRIPWLRRFPKRVLNMLASYMAGTKIRDLNSGMRIFNRDLCYYLWDLFPPGFSFTSTITMGGIMGGFRIKEVPINYYKRAGQSSIHPIRDTIRFFRLVCRLGLIFYPMKIFAPVATALLLVGAWKGFFVDYATQGYIGNLAAMSMLAAVQVFMMGLIGKLIVHSRFLRREYGHARKDQTYSQEDSKLIPLEDRRASN